MKTALTILCLQLMASTAFAVATAPTDVNVNIYDSSLAPERTDTLLNAVTSTGAGTAIDFGSALSQFTCHIIWGGTSPTSTLVALEGSIDGVTYGSLAGSVTPITASGTLIHAVNKPVRYVRGNFISKVGGDGTTAVTLVCLSGGN